MSGNTVIKKHSLNLEYGTHQYKVLSVTDSVEFVPGQWINRFPTDHSFHIPGIETVDPKAATVYEIVQRPDWTVTISDNQLWSQVLGTISSHISFNPV